MPSSTSADAVDRIGALAASGIGPPSARHALRPADVFGLLAQLVTDHLGDDVSVWLDHPPSDDLALDIGHGHRPEVVVHLAGEETWTITVARPSGAVLGASSGRPEQVAVALQELLAGM